MAARDRDPPPPEPAAPDDEERERRLRRVFPLVQAGGAVFLLVASLGLLPTILASWFPELGARATVVAWILAPLLAVGFVVVAAARLRR